MSRSCAHIPARPGRQRGLSLVEIMVAMVISLILLAGVVQIFIGSKNTYRVQEGLSRLQENGRFAIDIMARDVRMAGFQGCTRLGTAPGQVEPNIIVKTPPAALAFTVNDVLAGADDVSAGNALGARAGTDTLTIRGARPSSAKLTGNMTADNANIQIDSNPDNFEANDILIITDCINADIFQASAVSNGSGTTVTIAHANNVNTDNRLSKAYRDNAMLMRFETYTYFVADSGRTNAAGNPIYSLFRTSVDGSTEELIEGIEDLQIQYGVDTNDDMLVDTYVAAGGVGASQWGNIVAVRLSVLADTIENVATAETGYNTGTFSSNSPGDRKLRREFTTTVTLRNRAI